MNAGLSRRAAMMAALGAGGLLATGCELVGLQWRYRYRLTVSLVRGSDTRSGSGVIEIVRSKGYSGIGSDINGEAIVVDLPGRAPLFVLLSSTRWGSNWPSIVPHHAFSKQLGTTDMVNEKVLTKLANLKGVKVVLDTDLYPEFAMFSDVQVPSTIEHVDEGAVPHILQGYSIDKLEMEIVDLPVTTGLYSRLPWLRDQHGAITRPDITKSALDQPFSSQITEASFIQGSVK